MCPGDLIFIDQFIDRTTQREQTFYDGKTPGAPQGICHLQMHTSYHPKVRALLMEVATELGIHFHPSGTCVVVEGPRFSSVAESRMYKSWGAHVINMTTVPEVGQLSFNYISKLVNKTSPLGYSGKGSWSSVCNCWNGY